MGYPMRPRVIVSLRVPFVPNLRVFSRHPLVMPFPISVPIPLSNTFGMGASIRHFNIITKGDESG